MNGKVIVAVIAVAAMAVLGGMYFLASVTEQGAVTSVDGTPQNWNVYKNAEFGFEFRYPKTYFLEEREIGDAHRGHYLVMLTDDTEENRLVREGKSPGREGPVAVTFDIYQNDLDRVSLAEWLTGTNNSNFKLGDGTYATSTIAGREAVVYKWSGLYEADNVAFVHANSIFSAAVTYIDPNEGIRKDFRRILSTIQFTR